MPFPCAILFDLDDTIITEGDRAAILLEVAEEFADALAPHDPIAIADHIEVALEAFWLASPKARAARLGIPQWGIRQARETVIADTFREVGFGNAAILAEQFGDRFSDLRSSGTQLYAGARSTIETLKA